MEGSVPVSAEKSIIHQVMWETFDFFAFSLTPLSPHFRLRRREGMEERGAKIPPNLLLTGAEIKREEDGKRVELVHKKACPSPLSPCAAREKFFSSSYFFFGEEPPFPTWNWRSRFLLLLLRTITHVSMRRGRTLVVGANIFSNFSLFYRNLRRT